jgi:hypothetical protein
MNPPNLYCALELPIDFATAQNRFGIQWVEVWGVKKMKNNGEKIYALSLN